MIERGGERRGGGESLALAKLQIPALVLARYPSFMPNVNPECKLLTAYVGRFYKAACVTPCILEVGVRTNSEYNQITSSSRVLLSTILLVAGSAATCSKQQRGTRSVRQDATLVMFTACPVDHVVHYIYYKNRNTLQL